MPLARFEKLDPTRKQRLFVAAREAFAKRGFEGAALQPILAEAGASKGGLYYWFEDRTDLFAWVASEVLTERLKVGGEPPEGADLWHSWEDRSRSLVERAGHEPQGPEIVRIIASFSPALREDPRLDALFTRARAPYERWLAAGQAQGVVRRDLPMDLLVDLVLGVESSVGGWLHRVGEVPDDEASVARLSRLETRLVQRLVQA